MKGASLIAVGLLVVAIATPALARQLTSSGSHEWTKFTDKSCMDDGGDSMDIVRDVSAKTCKRACVDTHRCVAVTYSDSGNCYLKSSCDNLEERHNGDDSFLLDRHPDETDSYEWTKESNLSCMDDDGENLQIIRNLDAKHCKVACEAYSNDECVAITLGDSGSCYLKSSCNYLESRHNGDNSWTLDRGDCKPPTQVMCPPGSSSPKCKEYCGSTSVYSAQQQCGGVIYVCM